MHYVIIGGGPAGAHAAIEIRKNDEMSKITIVSNENHEYYKRSKIINLISGSCSEDDLYSEGMEIYEKLNINFINATVMKVLSQKNQLILENSSVIQYDSLLIASGGSPVLLPWKGVDLNGITTLYTLDDARAVAEIVCDVKNAVIIGGGAIAMKVIHNFFKIGIHTTIIEKTSHLWPIGFDRKMARIVEGKIKEKGIEIYLDEEVIEFKGNNGKLTSVLLKSGKEFPAELAVITIGMKPNIGFLDSSEVINDRGILVNENLQSNIPNIYAAGDVAQIYDPLYEKPMLHPTLGNAKKQGKVAAMNMMGKKSKYPGCIPIQTIKIFGYQAIAGGITHSKKNLDEILWISFEKNISRKLVLKYDKLMGVLLLDQSLNKKKLKPLIKTAVFNMVDMKNHKDIIFNDNIDSSFDFVNSDKNS